MYGVRCHNCFAQGSLMIKFIPILITWNLFNITVAIREGYDMHHTFLCLLLFLRNPSISLNTCTCSTDP